MDHTVATMILSSCGSQEVGQVKQFTHKRNVLVPRPRIIAKYNKYMGGTDQMDQNIACYRTGVREKRWF